MESESLKLFLTYRVVCYYEVCYHNLVPNMWSKSCLLCHHWYKSKRGLGKIHLSKHHSYFTLYFIYGLLYIVYYFFTKWTLTLIIAWQQPMTFIMLLMTTFAHFTHLSRLLLHHFATCWLFPKFSPYFLANCVFLCFALWPFLTP